MVSFGIVSSAYNGQLFKKKPFPSLLVYCLLFFVFNYFHVNYLYFGTSLMALPFYLCGYYNKTLTNRLVESKWNILFFLVFLILTVLMSRYNGKVSMMGMSYGKADIKLLRVILFFVNGIVGSYMLLCSVGWIKKRIGVILLPSRCAISIVGLQVIPMMIWIKAIGFNQNYLFSFIYAVLIMVTCILFHLFAEKRANWIVGGK